MFFAGSAFSNFSDKNKVSELKNLQSFAVKRTIDQVYAKHSGKMCLLQGTFSVFLSSFSLLQMVAAKVTVEPETEGNCDEQISNVLFSETFSSSRSAGKFRLFVRQRPDLIL